MGRILLCLLVVTNLISCASKKIVDTELYLRSEFTYWEALEKFRFKQDFRQQSSDDIPNLTLSASILADGNPYHFKIADKVWSGNKNCGYKNLEERVIQFGQWVELQCRYDHKNLKSTPIQYPFEFLPPSSGNYVFEIEHINLQPTRLRVSKVN